MKILELFRLWHRANRYRIIQDRGGISYVLSAVAEGDIVMDIGAHKAGFLYFFRKQVGKTGKIYAFEPQTRLYNYIKRIKELFKWGNVTVEHLALSNITGTATLYIPSENGNKGNSPGATIVENNDKTGFLAVETVNTETLDSYCTLNKINPSFLKIDVEGNELKIFKGGAETLKKNKPAIYAEIEAKVVGRKRVLETFRFLESLGYTGSFVHGFERIPLSSFTFEKYQDLDNKKDYCNNFIFE
jgi:FkbM family methyltransferase